MSISHSDHATMRSTRSTATDPRVLALAQRRRAAQLLAPLGRASATLATARTRRELQAACLDVGVALEALRDLTAAWQDPQHLPDPAAVVAVASSPSGSPSRAEV